MNCLNPTPVLKKGAKSLAIFCKSQSLKIFLVLCSYYLHSFLSHVLNIDGESVNGAKKMRLISKVTCFYAGWIGKGTSSDKKSYYAVSLANASKQENSFLLLIIIFISFVRKSVFEYV